MSWKSGRVFLDRGHEGVKEARESRGVRIEVRAGEAGLGHDSTGTRRWPARKRARGGAAEARAMTTQTSSTAGAPYPLRMVCTVFGVPPATVYAQTAVTVDDAPGNRRAAHDGQRCRPRGGDWGRPIARSASDCGRWAGESARTVCCDRSRGWPARAAASRLSACRTCTCRHDHHRAAHQPRVDHRTAGSADAGVRAMEDARDGRLIKDRGCPRTGFAT